MFISVIGFAMSCTTRTDPYAPRINTIIELDKIEKTAETVKIPAKVIYNNDWFNVDSKPKEPFIPWTSNLLEGPDSTLYIFDFSQSRIVQLTNEGQYIRSVGGPGSGPGEFMGPNPHFIRSANLIYIPDTYGLRLQIFDLNCKHLRTINNLNLEGGLFAIGPNGSLLSSPTQSVPQVLFMILMHDSLGQPIKKIGAVHPNDDILFENNIRNHYLILANESTKFIWCLFRYSPVIRKYDYDGNFLEQIYFKSAALEKAIKDGKDYIKKFQGQKVAGGGILIFNNVFLIENGDLLINLCRHGNIRLTSDESKSRLTNKYEFLNLPPKSGEKALIPNRFRLVKIANKFYAYDEKGIVIKQE